MNHESDQLDAIDRSLLRLLQEDGRRTTLDLAARVGLSPTGTSQRVKRLFREGFITAVRAVLNPQKIGRGTLVFIEVRLDQAAPHVFDRFAEAVAKAPEVLECHMVVGGFDYLVKARISEMAAYQDFLKRVILPLPGVRETHTYASISDVKPDALLPV
ncbi:MULTISPECIES: Lrp/AsnC ligand binding domain-containing protein [unclassified Mesorhizobium]|uniref:Lrp/AsnC family transcriptional regulator n=1 Tax=unclassified Mesorhizobium TaxID=325217 RepID=UPI0003CF060F|nr:MULTISPECIES: Lrp/AsnC ligand binding domain-containing protein [unclassified Mesorhizobium]ESX27073.1 AsnC family transcriptional regulator [Mesorhizobium sp. LSHC440B00]ESX36259.1 AsnC family transcriptional regulator [Mesorhizobium sp. LSHC432A00]ESX74396.1 AsnC family transcriptional regulator [Mesorhizobium sp. LSHC414A00]ESX87581.1 AsnC family transcriptional regulator [Mesorhizobium sp. LNJC405B00]ESY25230.1 AsnC family transcriptional regulator [Mesorhizobium sp. LNJC394B00]